MAEERFSGLASMFDQAAQHYLRIRPGYPAQLFDDLARETALGARARVLEIGAGAGQATRGLLERGWSVVALEPGPSLATLAGQALRGVGDVDVVVSTFEQ
jgi:16S rRNA A1518/A1519 N6-dimethyltransferase RsmA/KsgA/DIM1 with predicted DNA glycosylase/AP lyase activity